MSGLNPLALIESIDFMSNHAPNFSINVNAPSDPNTSAAIINFLKTEKPMLRFNFIGGISPTTIAPYGEPGPSKWPTLKIGLTVVGAVSTALLLSGLLHAIFPKKR